MKFLSLRSMAVILLAALVIAPASRVGAQANQRADLKTLTLGLVFESAPEPVAERFRPLVEYAARRLAPAGQTKGRVVVAPSAQQLMRLLDEQSVDFYMESPYPTYVINRAGAANMILRRWKSGMSEYRSLIVTRKVNGIARLEDLPGKMIAFEDAGSTSGYILPKLFLLNKRFKIVEKPALDAKIAANEIGYIFAGTEQQVINHLVQGKVAAGAISNDDHANLDEKTKAQLTILGESESLPRHLVSVRRDLPGATIKQLKEILLNMRQDDQGMKILRDTDSTTKFDTLPGGEEAFRQRLLELFRPRISK